MRREYYILKYKISGVEGSIYKDYWTRLAHSPMFNSAEECEEFYLRNKDVYDRQANQREIGIFKAVHDETFILSVSQVTVLD